MSRRFLSFCLLSLLASGATAWADTLVFKNNGDRLAGTYVSTENGQIVFNTERFGIMRIAQAEALVELESTAAGVSKPAISEPQAGDAAMQPAMASASAEAAQLAMSAPKAAAIPKADPWHVRLAFSTELTHDTADRTEWIFELRLERKWAKDELRIEPRYEFRSENDNATADLFKVHGYYRHDIGRWWFLQYLPYYELNRQYTYQNLPLDYQYLRNEFGGGVRVVDQPGKILRVGAAKSFYNIHLIKYDQDIALNGESVFVEAELDLPWRVSIRDRGQFLWYSDGDDQGAANELEVTKHLTDVWWIGIRHEFRMNAPELQGDDMTKLKLFLGVDF